MKTKAAPRGNEGFRDKPSQTLKETPVGKKTGQAKYNTKKPSVAPVTPSSAYSSSSSEKDNLVPNSPAIIDASALVLALEEKYASLLMDSTGKRRAAFMQLPPDVLSLLQDAWDLGPTKSTDRVTRHLRKVQSYSPNLMNYALETPGFPSHIFKPKNRAKDAEMQLQFELAKHLMEMGCMPNAQAAEFYLSFLKSSSSVAQDPHIDFNWEIVQQPTQESSQDSSLNNRNSPRHRKLPYMERVPFVSFFPLTESGMQVEVWKARANHSDYIDGEDDGVLVHIPMGVLFMVRGDVVHAGGFMASGEATAKSRGDPRGHLYIYRNTGEVHATNLSNTYTLPSSSARLDTVYKHCKDAQPAFVFKSSKFAISRSFATNQNSRQVPKSDSKR